MAILSITRRGFPGTITLFRRGGRFESASLTSGEDVLTDTDGSVLMTFQCGAQWQFENGTQQQHTTRTVAAGTPAPVTMGWKLSTALNNALNTEISVAVSQGSSTQHEFVVMQVKYATMTENFFHGIRRMFQTESSR